MVPAEGGGSVFPVDSCRKIGTATGFKIILTPVNREKKPVILIDIVVQFQVKVREMEVLNVRIPVLQWPGDIGTSSRRKKRDMLLPDGTLQGEP